MECDLLRYYGVDLLDAYRRPARMTLRRVAVLVRGLPPESATVRAIEPAAEWTVTEHLLAGVLDTLRTANWMTVEINKSKGARNPYPEPITRPGGDQAAPTAEKPPMVNAKQLSAFLAKVG